MGTRNTVVGGCLILLSMGIGPFSVTRDPTRSKAATFQVDSPSLFIELIFDNA